MNATANLGSLGITAKSISTTVETTPAGEVTSAQIWSTITTARVLILLQVVKTVKPTVAIYVELTGPAKTVNVFVRTASKGNTAKNTLEL